MTGIFAWHVCHPEEYNISLVTGYLIVIMARACIFVQISWVAEYYSIVNRVEKSKVISKVNRANHRSENSVVVMLSHIGDD